jgi:NADH:ubiquinone oxidoreductase subunit H
MLVSVAFLVLLERTFLGAVQLRTRPMFVRLYGVIQTVVDRIKLLNKRIGLNNFYARLFLGRVLIFLILSNLIALSFYLIARIIVMYQGILVSNNIYSKIGRYRMILLS